MSSGSSDRTVGRAVAAGPRARGVEAGSGSGSGARWRAVLAGAGLLCGIAAVYGQTLGFGFVNLDDQQYVYENPLVRGGLSWPAVVRAFGFHAANWHPLTWLSHMADVEAFGLDARGHHLVNVLLHAANALLLLAWLRRATGAPGRSWVVAAVFALHPLHVESVAWVSERKDVLSTLFLLLALHTYLSWTRRPRGSTYAATALLLALGLLAKQMLVTAPLLLLVLDGWPLGRLGAGAEPRVIGRRVLEKLPLLALAAGAAGAAWLAQSGGGATAELQAIPLGGRIANALVAYAAYLRKAFWPADLAAFYPHPLVGGPGLAAWRVAGAGVLLAALTAIAWRERRRRPWILVGWLWYLGTLVPVIGIVQVGTQAMADRYTYVPLVGVAIAVVWTAADLLARARRGLAWAAAALALAPLAVAARAQAATWRDSETLHAHALRVTEGNWNAWLGLGDARSEAGRPAEAIAAYQEALRVLPRFAKAWSGLGVAEARLGRPERGVAPLEQAVRLDPRDGEAWYNLGTVHGNLGDHARAAACFRRAVELRPDDARAWENLGIASLLLGDRDGALESWRRLTTLDPARAAAMRQRLDRSAR